jgi:hypothetical protein
MVTAEDLSNIDFVRGYTEGRESMNLYAAARLQLVENYIKEQVKEVLQYTNKKDK